MFRKAVKTDAKLRMSIVGPSGSGKTFTALALATRLANGKPIALVDTEHGSASKYADLFDFDVAEMHEPFHPDKFGTALKAAAAAGYGVIILDSLTHAWNGTGGLLEIVDEFAKRQKSANSFTAWKDATPIQNRLIENIMAADIHVIATMRSKTEYVIDTNDRGKSAPRKVGMAPIQRDGFEYEFDIVLDMDQDNNAIVSKTRCMELSGRVFAKPDENIGSIIANWLAAPDTAQQAPAQRKPAPPVQKAPPLPEEQFNGQPPAPAQPMPTEAARKAFHAMGTQLYGKDWDAKRAELVEKVTTGATKSSKDLTASEMARLSAGMDAKLAQLAQPDAKVK